MIQPIRPWRPGLPEAVLVVRRIGRVTAKKAGPAIIRPLPLKDAAIARLKTARRPHIFSVMETKLPEMKNAKQDRLRPAIGRLRLLPGLPTRTASR